MKTLLLQLLESLEKIGKAHEELYDSEPREAMREAIYYSFLKPTQGYSLPDDYELLTEQGNRLVKAALEQYISAANRKSAELRLDFHGRLAVFQDSNVKTAEEGNYYDDFFGYARPNSYDSSGNWVG
jgi:hypothetical protein